MNNKKYSHITLALFLTGIALFVSYASVGAAPVRAWEPPTGTFPNKNPAPNLTVSTKSETKAGDLTVARFSAWQNALFQKDVTFAGILRADDPSTPGNSTLRIGGVALGSAGTNVKRTTSLAVVNGNVEVTTLLATSLATATTTGVDLTAATDGLCADSTGTIVRCNFVATADVCSNIKGSAAIPTGMYQDASDGACQVSACSNIQVKTVPAAMYKDASNGKCFVSACNNKNVETVPAGEVVNADGSCSVPTTAAVSYRTMTGSDAGYTSKADACSKGMTYSGGYSHKYDMPFFVSGDYIYQNGQPFNGKNKWQVFQFTGVAQKQAAQIDASGNITDYGGC